MDNYFIQKQKKSISTYDNRKNLTNKTTNYVNSNHLDDDDDDNKTMKKAIQPKPKELISNYNSPGNLINKLYKKDAQSQLPKGMPPIQQNYLDNSNQIPNKTNIPNNDRYFKHYFNPNNKVEAKPLTVASPPKETNPELIKYRQEIQNNDLVKNNPQAIKTLNKVSTAQEFLIIIGYFQLLEDLKNKTKDLDKLEELQEKNAQSEEVIENCEKEIKKLTKENKLLSEQLTATRIRENKLQVEKRAISKSPLPIRTKKE